MKTAKDLREMSDKELRELQRSLGSYLNTSLEKEARLLNQAIYDEKDSRYPYGF